MGGAVEVPNLGFSVILQYVNNMWSHGNMEKDDWLKLDAFGKYYSRLEAARHYDPVFLCLSVVLSLCFVCNIYVSLSLALPVCLSIIPFVHTHTFIYIYIYIFFFHIFPLIPSLRYSFFPIFPCFSPFPLFSTVFFTSLSPSSTFYISY